MKRDGETALIKSIRERLTLMGYWVLRHNAGAIVLGDGSSRRMLRGVEPGTPDLQVLLPYGRSAWLEVKTPKGRVSKVQAQWHARARALDHHVFVVRSVEDAVDAVRAIR